MHRGGRMSGERLEDTRRRITASLVAQMLFTAIAYLFTVITSFNADLGDPATALQIAPGSLWIWLVGCPTPVVHFFEQWLTFSSDPGHLRMDHCRNSIFSRHCRASIGQAGSACPRAPCSSWSTTAHGGRRTKRPCCWSRSDASATQSSI